MIIKNISQYLIGWFKEGLPIIELKKSEKEDRTNG